MTAPAGDGPRGEVSGLREEPRCNCDYGAPCGLHPREGVVTDNQQLAAGLLPDAIRLHYPDVLDVIADALDEAEARGRADAERRATEAEGKVAAVLEDVLDDIQARTRNGSDADGWSAVAGIALDVLNRKAALDGD